LSHVKNRPRNRTRFGYNTRLSNRAFSMIRESVVEADHSVVRIEVLANLSLTLDRLAGVFLLISGVTLLVALLPTVMGYWPIMAIAVVHLALVGWCFRLAWRGNWARQDITIDPRRVRIETRTARSEDCREMPTGWVRVLRDDSRGEPRVSLGLHGRCVEIGRFVPASERLEVAGRIARALEPHTAWIHHGTEETARPE
jgi:uncharacterized membrane protein